MVRQRIDCREEREREREGEREREAGEGAADQLGGARRR
jgi:hypothetical protein